MSWESRLHTAVRQGRFDSVKELVNEFDIDSRNESGYTPLNVACYCGHVSIAKFLLDSGADIRKDNMSGWTPLHAACMMKKTAVVKLLLDRGAGDCVNVPSGSSGQTPLIVVCKNKYDWTTDILHLLVEAGADINFRGRHGKTPLMEATSRGILTKVKYLLEAGAEIDAVDDSGSTALHMATPYPEIVRLLIDLGADVNRTDRRGDIPLRKRDCIPKSASLLLDYGAADLPCRRHKNCKGTVFRCLFKAARSIRRMDLEKHVIKLRTAGLCVDPTASALVPSDLGSTSSHSSFQDRCDIELAKLKSGNIPETNCTYMDILFQRPHALKLVKPQALEHCREKFSIYGELIWSRYHSGCRRLPLMVKCIDFFSAAEDVPYLPPECVEEILSYLPERDLKTLLAIYDSAQPRSSSPSSQPVSKKRANEESPLRVMKFLKVC